MQTDKCDIVQHLYRGQELVAQKKRDKAFQIKELKEKDDELTFKPKTLNYNLPQGLTHGDKCLDLYARVRPGQYAKKNIQEPDLDFNAQRNQCAFSPRINSSGAHLSKPDQTLDEIKGVKQKLYQLAKGRQQQ